MWHVGCPVKFPYRPRPLWLVDSRHPGCVLRVFRSYLPLKICRCPRIEFRCLSVRIVRPVFYCLDFPLQSISLHCSAQFKSPRCTMENIFAIVLYLLIFGPCWCYAFFFIIEKCRSSECCCNKWRRTDGANYENSSGTGSGDSGMACRCWLSTHPLTILLISAACVGVYQ